jgi:hypothetical protein
LNERVLCQGVSIYTLYRLLVKTRSLDVDLITSGEFLNAWFHLGLILRV